MLPGWARKLRDQCRLAEIPFHFKQWGHWAPVATPKLEKPPAQKFWDEVSGKDIFMEPKGKKIAGRRLDGATWDGIPIGIRHERISA
jgi:protein gp37